MNSEKNDNYLVVKVATPISLKQQFKIRCAQEEVTMSKIMEELIEKWIRADVSVSDLLSKYSDQRNEDLTVYIPKNLKTQFKVLCAENNVTMRTVLCNLICEWVEAKTS